MSKEELEKLIFEYYNPNWRKGQLVFNRVEQLFGDIARKIQFEDNVDCFFNDEYIDKFLECALKRINETSYIKLDIQTLKPYDKVLIKYGSGVWYPSFVSYVLKNTVFVMEEESIPDYIALYEGNEEYVASMKMPKCYTKIK